MKPNFQLNYVTIYLPLIHYALGEIRKGQKLSKIKLTKTLLALLVAGLDVCETGHRVQQHGLMWCHCIVGECSKQHAARLGRPGAAMHQLQLVFLQMAVQCLFCIPPLLTKFQ